MNPKILKSLKRISAVVLTLALKLDTMCSVVVLLLQCVKESRDDEPQRKFKLASVKKTPDKNDNDLLPVQR